MTLNNTYECDPSAGADNLVELELTKQEWEIMVGALILLSHGARGSDAKVVRALSERLEPFRFKGAAVVTV